MKFRPLHTFLILFLLPAIIQAQDWNGKILMNIEGRNTEAGEFIRMYKKSIEPGKKQDFDEYLEHFINFKLKVADAMKEGLDTTRKFRDELNGYRNQLAQNYLTDPATKETLLRNAYQRYLTEVNAWHILISCPPGASPEDTLNAWKKATDIRTRVAGGEPFEKVARSASDDQTVMINGGNLGYFSAFQMIMPFEDAAYNLKPGAISNPVRTPYGYHIIKVTDKRKSKGRIRVAHIMKSVQPIGGKEEKESESEINRIYDELRKGSSFSELAKIYSDHKESALNGGILDWFVSGEVIPEFSEAAFSISDTGQYSKPVRSLYGWHIIKLLEKDPPGSYEDSKSYLESKINQSYLNSISKKSLIEKLKKEYNLRINRTAYNWFIKNTDTLLIRGLSRYRRDSMPSGNLYTFSDQRLTNAEFASYIEKRGPMIVTDSPQYFIDRSIETRLSDHIITYENSQLEKKYPDFRYLMNEFHDGLLLFDISARKIWDKVSEDSAGLRRYYDQNKKDYLKPRSIETKIYSLNSPGKEKKFRSAYKRYSRKSDTDNLLLKKFNRKNDTILTIKERTLIEGDDPKMDKMPWITGMIIDKQDSIIVIKNVLEPTPLSLEEVQEEMMQGFQDDLESEWITQLKQKYNVSIDNGVLVEVKKKLANE
jgi:peptidyl-prolyl cis-trans isomerase SurA